MRWTAFSTGFVWARLKTDKSRMFWRWNFMGILNIKESLTSYETQMTFYGQICWDFFFFWKNDDSREVWCKKNWPEEIGLPTEKFTQFENMAMGHGSKAIISIFWGITIHYPLIIKHGSRKSLWMEVSFASKITDAWSIFQHGMFDYRRVTMDIS